MTNTQSPKAPKARPRSRKSIAHAPTPEATIGKENTGGEILSTGFVVGKTVGKKPRSKSLGPGGLDALKEGTGNQQKSDLILSVKSILKPTIPLSPPKQIPPHAGARNASPRKSRQATSPVKGSQNGRLIDFSLTPTSLNQSGLENVPNPFQDHGLGELNELQAVQVSTVTEEEQHQAEAKAQERLYIIKQRDERRKSMANRRVSFAPEATLHTWDVVELPEDTTTSSEATNSTRRGSVASSQMASPHPHPQHLLEGSDFSEPPSTPPEQIEEVQVTVSPVHQRDMHQKKRRRSSVIPPMNFNNPDDFSSSPGSSMASDDMENPTLATADGNVDSSDDSDNDLIEDDGTMTELIDDDLTSRSIVSAKSNGSSNTSSSSRLEAALRQAAVQAGTQGIDYDENGDLTMEMADEEITASFKPWVDQASHKSKSMMGSSYTHDLENMNPFSPAFKANLKVVSGAKEDQEETMDFTHAAGKILHQAPSRQASPNRRRRKSELPTGSIINTSRPSADPSAEDSLLADETMDITTAFGRIQQKANEDETGSVNGNEELTMEFTSVLGGVIDQSYLHPSIRSNSTSNNSLSNQEAQEGFGRTGGSQAAGEEEMDMTMAVGGILETITERTEPDESQTYTMDITTAIGSILPKGLTTNDRSMAKALMECETDAGQLVSSPFRDERADNKPLINEKLDVEALITHPPITISETGSPKMMSAKNRRSARGALDTRVSTTPMSSPQQVTPSKKPSTPSKQLTPKPTRPTTPGKTPPPKNVTLRTSSPKKLFRAEIKQSAGTPKRPNPILGLEFDLQSGAALPNIVLTPKRRRISGLGIDKEGLGSPKLAELLDRRGSIGEQAGAFTPQGTPSSKVRFEDPRTMEQEIERERAEIQRHESGRGILQMEADMHDFEEERGTSANLKDMIESLTPKKNRLKGRKSLHVGTARGLLGKRPVELDEDEEDDHTPKRLKGRENSPVKNIKLLAPPSKAETTGRVTKAPRFSLGESSNNAQLSTPKKKGSPTRSAIITTPKDQGRFKDAEIGSITTKPLVPFELKLAGASQIVEPIEEDDRIHLQEFLNMTSIRFMELTTTKRRHTIVPNNVSEYSVRKNPSEVQGGLLGKNDRDLENCVIAGACTVPMLELYQHSCRELKKYISEGRNIVREIEADTFEENPALFREYISAAPDVKSIMDIQFKNVKTHARLLSKATWYEWRSKLLDGLKEGLLKIREGLDEDAQVLAQQERLLQPVLPKLVEEHETLRAEAQLLQAQADELANCDQKELKEVRQQVAAADKDLEAKRKMIADLQQKLRDQDDDIECAVERKQWCLDEIKEAERVGEECRGWSGAEVAILKAKVDALEESSGWTISSASGRSLTLAHRRALCLFLTPSSFHHTSTTLGTVSSENSPIGLIYVADTHDYHPIPLSTEKRFFLQIMRARLQCLPQAQTTIKDVLAFVSAGWENASAVAEEIRRLGLTYITDAVILADEVLVVKTMLLLQNTKTKVEVSFRVEVGGVGLVLKVGVEVAARVVYGEGLDGEKMEEVLRGKVEGVVGRWAVGVRELEAKVKGKGRERGSGKGKKA